MNIPSDSGRVAAIAFDDDSQAGAVWIAAGPDSGLTLYDSCIFGDLPPERVAEALRARGKMVVVWEARAKSVADRLLYEGGANMISDPVSEDEAMAAMLSRDLADRLKRGQFTAGERETEWKREYDAWRRAETAVASTPLLKATRLALARIEYAKPVVRKPRHTPLAPKVSIL